MDEIIGFAYNRNYLGILDLISESDTEYEHFQHRATKGIGYVSFMSFTVWDECIQIFGQYVEEVIVTERKTAKYSSLPVNYYWYNPYRPAHTKFKFIPNCFRTSAQLAFVLLELKKKELV